MLRIFIKKIYSCLVAIFFAFNLNILYPFHNNFTSIAHSVRLHPLHATIDMYINALKININLHYIQEFVLHLAENTVWFH
jgi:hypothetical protein